MNVPKISKILNTDAFQTKSYKVTMGNGDEFYYQGLEGGQESDNLFGWHRVGKTPIILETARNKYKRMLQDRDAKTIIASRDQLHAILAEGVEL